MHRKAFFLTIATLIAAVTIYPPYLWGQERKIEFQLLVQYKVPTSHDTMPDFAPIKARAFLLGSNEKELQVGWNWDNTNQRSFPNMEPLKRQLSWEDLLLEYVLAGCVSIIVGVLTFKRSKEI